MAKYEAICAIGKKHYIDLKMLKRLTSNQLQNISMFGKSKQNRTAHIHHESDADIGSDHWTFGASNPLVEFRHEQSLAYAI
eukprot:6470263-Amphidinium_carterae.1